MNALTYLYEPREIPAEVIRMVYLCSLDDPRKDISTKEWAKALIEWMNEYSKNKNRRKPSFFIKAEILEEENVNLCRNNKICTCLNEAGVALCDIRYPGGDNMMHTMLALNHDSEWIYFWDPYYRRRIREEYKKYKYVKPCADENRNHNLLISKKWLDKDSNEKYTFGTKKDRYCILLKRDKTY